MTRDDAESTHGVSRRQFIRRIGASSVAAGVLAVCTDSLLIALIGIAGGYATPVLLRTPTPNLPVFYSYILLLSVGILGVARARQWRLLNYVGFVCTYVLFVGSIVEVYERADFALAIGSCDIVPHRLAQPVDTDVADQAELLDRQEIALEGGVSQPHLSVGVDVTDREMLRHSLDGPEGDSHGERIRNQPGPFAEQDIKLEGMHQLVRQNVIEVRI